MSKVLRDLMCGFKFRFVAKLLLARNGEDTPRRRLAYANACNLRTVTVHFTIIMILYLTTSERTYLNALFI